MNNLINSRLKKKNSKIIYLILILLSVFGLFIITIVSHEILHIIQSQGRAKAICVDLNLMLKDDIQKGYLLAHTVLDKKQWSSSEEYNAWRRYTEKSARILEIIMYLGVSGIIGWLLVTKRNSKLLIVLLIILAIPGLFFLSIMGTEAINTAKESGAKSICINFEEEKSDIPNNNTDIANATNFRT